VNLEKIIKRSNVDIVKETELKLTKTMKYQYKVKCKGWFVSNVTWLDNLSFECQYSIRKGTQRVVYAAKDITVDKQTLFLHEVKCKGKYVSLILSLCKHFKQQNR